MAKDWESFKDELIHREKDRLVWRMAQLEKNISSPIERIMHVILYDEFTWAMQQNRTKIEHQKRIGPYTADFYMTYLSDKDGLVKFIIECDGHDYHERTKAQASHDKKRDRYFTEQGYIVLRFTGSEIVKDPWNLTSSIYQIIVQKDGVVGCG